MTDVAGWIRNPDDVVENLRRARTIVFAVCVRLVADRIDAAHNAGHLRERPATHVGDWELFSQVKNLLHRITFGRIDGDRTRDFCNEVQAFANAVHDVDLRRAFQPRGKRG